MNIPTKKLRPDAVIPTKAHASDAAFDLYLPSGHGTVGLAPGQRHTLRIGIAMAIPEGWMLKIEGRSGLASKGVQIMGGIVDSSYRGEIGVILRNSGEEPREFVGGERIAQALILPVPQCVMVEVDKLDETVRGIGGFGSSGK